MIRNSIFHFSVQFQVHSFIHFTKQHDVKCIAVDVSAKGTKLVVCLLDYH